MNLFKKFGKQKRIYLDYASATPVDVRVLGAMMPYFADEFANPSALHRDGVRAREAIEIARKKTAEFLGAHTDEIIFTSGGTESDTLAVLGVIEGWRDKNSSAVFVPHIIISDIEHPAIRELCKHLALKEEIELTLIPVSPNGIVDVVELKKAIRPETILISIMYTNNEIGTIQPIAEIAKIINHYKRHREGNVSDENKQYPLFHTDAAQAVQYIDMNVEKIHVDLLSFNGTKIYAPKGVGVLYKRRNISFTSPFAGGGQESGFRSGTENVPAIIGLGIAIEIVEKTREPESTRVSKLRDSLITELVAIPGITLNGDPIIRLPNNINISVAGIPSELLVLELDARGISVSAKSACQSDDPDESYVLKALDQTSSSENGSIRFSLGRDTIMGEITKTISIFKKIIEKLRPWYPIK